MATGVWTTTIADKHIGEVWPGAVIRAQEFNIVWADKVYRKWKFAGHGDVYHFPRVANIETTTKTGGSDWAPYNYTDTEQTITINVHQVTGIEVEDITKVLNNTDVEMEYRRKMGYSLARALDVNLATLPASFSQNVGTLGVELTYDNLIRAWRYLADAGIDTNNDTSLIMSPAAIAGLLKSDIFISSLYQGPNPRMVESNKMGAFRGMDIIMSNLTRAPSAGQSESAMFFRNAIGLITAQTPKVVTEYKALSLAMIIGSHQIYGYGEIDRYSETPGNITATDEWAVLLKTIG